MTEPPSNRSETRLLWIPPLLAAIAVFLYRYFRGLIQGVEIGRTTINVVVFFSVIDITVMTAIPIFYVHQSIDLRRPSITLRSITLSGDFRTLVAVYNVDTLSLLRVEEASIRAAGRDFRVENCSVEGDVLKMSVPKGIYGALYLNATSEVSSFWAYCTIMLDKGVLYGFYPVTFNWKRLEVSVENNTMMVSNPNPVPLNASVEIQYYGLDRFGRLTYLNSEFFQAVFEPASTSRIRPTGERVTSYVILRYVFLNSSIVESRRVDLVGG